MNAPAPAGSGERALIEQQYRRDVLDPRCRDSTGRNSGGDVRTCLIVMVVCGAVASAQSGQPVRAPRLPETPYRYAAVDLPAHFEAARAHDNTPRANRLTDAGAALGRVLFYDTQLSANNTTACASCHRHQHAFADPRRFSVGFDGRQTDRHAMNLTGLRYYRRARFFWDERGGNLEEMVLTPVRSSIEMGEDLARLPPKLASLAYYPELFRRAFGDPAVTERRIARALAQFLRSLVSYRSRYDRGLARASSVMDPFANFSREENHGKALFFRNCASCHLPVQDPNFFLLLPRTNGAERPTRDDAGLGDFTLSAEDFGRFKSPSLRNVEVAGPYMHDGSLTTLEDVIEHYSRNFKPQAPLDFTDSEKRALVAFLKTLTDHDFLNDPKFSDPFTPAAAAAPPPREPTPRAPAVPAPERPGVDDVIARIVGFDRNADGRIDRDELPERMRDIVARGDRNGSASLDRDEVRVLVSSDFAAGLGFGITRADLPIVLNLRPAPEATVEALLGDLGLDALRRDAALVAIASDREEASNAGAASVERFRNEVQALLEAKQLFALTSILERQLRGPVRLVPERDSVRVVLLTAEVDRAMSAWSLPPAVRAAVGQAAAAHRQRVSVLAADPAALLRRLEPILTASELGDLAAAIKRHRPASLTGAR
jgi:cytochrome c peroxidase